MRTWAAILALAGLTLRGGASPQRAALGPAHVDITWMSISNIYYEFGSLGVLTDGYISRVPQSDFFGGGGGLANTHTPFASDTAAVTRVLDALGGPSRVGLLLTGHSHFDHSLDTATWSKLTGARIIGSKTTCLQAEAEGVPATRCMAIVGGERLQIAAGVMMRVIRWNHSGDPAVNPEQHNPVELKSVPIRDPATGGLHAGVAEDFPNGGGNRAFLFTVDSAEGRLSWFFQNSASAVDLAQPIVVDGVNYGAPIENLKAAMKDAALDSVDLWIGTGGQTVAAVVAPIIKPKAYLPVHWDGLWGAFNAGPPAPYTDPPLEAFLAKTGIQLIVPAEYMDKWRLDRTGVHAVPNAAIKQALGFASPVAAVGAAVHALTGPPLTCASLPGFVAPDVPMAITDARIVAAGAFQPGGTVSAANARVYAALPSFCRVSIALTPTRDSDIKVEVWLPVSNWNGKYEAVGNGGWAGSIGYAAMADALARGYATSGTDTGHTGANGAFALDHPEKLIDYASRSEHLMANAAKPVIFALYGRGPTESYWNGCSNGGKQGLKEAQQFPFDFDGIIAGAPAANWIGRAAQSIWIAQANLKDAASELPPAKLSVIHAAVLAACDVLDGVKDGVLEDPTRCHFDPGVLACASGDSPGCLTAPQVEVVRRIYAPLKHAGTGAVIFPGHEPGSELGWTTMAGPRVFQIGLDHFRYTVFGDPNWDYRTLNFDRDMDRAFEAGATLNALNPRLSDFFGHGGKLIQYHGWSDPQISPRSSVEYYQSVMATLGSNRVLDAYRLFMVPGMAHCGGGEGPNSFDMLTALENWVERGVAPDQILASRESAGQTPRTRPLCPYPAVAVYTGRGSTDESTNFVCKVP